MGAEQAEALVLYQRLADVAADVAEPSREVGRFWKHLVAPEGSGRVGASRRFWKRRRFRKVLDKGKGTRRFRKGREGSGHSGRFEKSGHGRFSEKGACSRAD